MAQDQQTIELSHDSYTQLTNANVTNITFQLLDGQAYIRFSAGVTRPDASNFGLFYEAPFGEVNTAISDLCQLFGANRVWARAAGERGATILVDHG